MAQELLLMNPRRRSRRRRGPLGRFLPSVHRRRNPESERERSLAARRGWAHRRKRRRNPESERERSLAARRGWMHRRRRRNPLVMDLGGRKGLRTYRKRNPIGGDVTETLASAAYGAAGALALDALFGYVPLPAAIAGPGTPINYAAKGVGALAVGWIASKVLGARVAKEAADGALTVVMHEAARAAITKFSPTVGAKLGDLQPIYISPGAIVGQFNPMTGAAMGDLQYTGVSAQPVNIPSGI